MQIALTPKVFPAWISKDKKKPNERTRKKHH